MAFDPKNPGQNRGQNYPNPPVDMSAPGSAPQMPYNQGAHQSPYGAPRSQSQMPYPKGQRPMYWQPQPPMQPQPPVQPQPPMQPKKGGAAKWVLLICLLLVVGLAAVVVWNPFHEHQWQAATCGAPQTCATCGATQGTLRSHNWQAATCVSPAYCTSCGAVEGAPLGHQWVEATYQTPMTCKICLATEGERLKADPIYLNEMPFLNKVGKLWTSSEYSVNGPVHTSVADLTVWKQESIPGHTKGPVYDHFGNSYTYGMFLDGSSTTTYFISYDLEGKYTDFSCYVAFPGHTLSKRAKESIKKVVEFYVDGELVATTPEMSINAGRAYISFDVSGGQILTIQYAKVDGCNEAATIFDPLLR